MEQVTVADAAARLGVSEQRVRALITDGSVSAVKVAGIWLIDPETLSAYGHQRRQSAGRSLSPRMAWAALLTTFGTSQAEERSAFGLRANEWTRIRQLRDRALDDWRWLARRRCAVRHFDTRTAYLNRIAADARAIPAGVSASGLHDLSSSRDELDVYVAAATAQELVTTLSLRPAGSGNLTLRSVDLPPDQLDLVLGRRTMPAVAIAIDLIEQRDERTHAAGIRLLRQLTESDEPQPAR